jgi:exosortase B
MPAVLEARSSAAGTWLLWLPVAAGLLALYVPVFYELANSLWRSDDYAHGPIILCVVVWLIWCKRGALAAVPRSAAPALGVGLLVLGLLAYVLGRSQDITILEVGALVPILAGSLLALRGWSGLRALWFPLLFVAFMVPLPGIFVDALTGPLKQYVSETAETLLYAAGYPVARNGVMLTVGHYQLLVADACSGLNSMFSLSALGVLYLYLVRRKSLLHNGLILASILPIAFAANIIRVLTLVLVTYHLGDAAGQGFLHGAAGMVLLLAALALLLVLDAVLARAFLPRATA